MTIRHPAGAPPKKRGSTQARWVYATRASATPPTVVGRVTLPRDFEYLVPLLFPDCARMGKRRLLGFGSCNSRFAKR